MDVVLRCAHEMSPEEQRVAIAEACGWKRGKRTEHSFADSSKMIAHDCWISPKGSEERKLPDYLSDLNAMREAELTLNIVTQGEPYYRHLQKIVTDYKGTSKWFVPIVMATAPQRAKAFLRTIGKWKD